MWLKYHKNTYFLIKQQSGKYGQFLHYPVNI